MPGKIDQDSIYHLRSYYTVDISIPAFRDAISDKRVIICACRIDQSNVNSTGIVEKLDNNVTAWLHAISIVGYDDALQLFKFRNSWGPGWGDHGYGYLRYKDLSTMITQAYALNLSL
jgi:C1A family cysteine protease